MSTPKSSLPSWPFILVDALFIGLAALILVSGHQPLTWQESGLLVLCGALGSWSFLTPFLRRNEDEQAGSQMELLTEATSKIQKLDQLASQINGATNQWLEMQTHAKQAADHAKQIADRMETEAKAFVDFMQQAGEAEKAHLRVEVEKLRRAEGERLQVMTHILDHVYALFQAARKSGHPGLIEHINQFQNACREAARRIGLVQTVAPTGEAFDAKLHQLPEKTAAPKEARITETVIPGYTYQGQLVRKPLVALKMADDLFAKE